MPLKQQYEARRTHSRNCYAAADFSVIELDGESIGRLCRLRAAHDHAIVDIAFLPEQCGEGLGSVLPVRSSPRRRGLAAASRCASIITNPARRLYERKGFRETERTETDAEMASQV